jgi:hypothetical protein
MTARSEVIEEPAADLVRRLRSFGRTDLSAALSELVPAPDAVGPMAEHEPALRAVLLRLAAEVDLAADARDAAADIVGALDDLPLRIGRQGTVWIGWSHDPYDAYWSADSRDWLQGVEPDTSTLGECLDWARARARRVLVRPRSDPDCLFWAGEGASPGGMPTLPDEI